jgi:hypothetical protein
MRQKLFDEISSIISVSASYNQESKVVQIDTNNIRIALRNIKPVTVDKIIFAAELIAKEQSSRLQYNALTLAKNSQDLKLSLASFSNIILKSDYLESSILAKDKLCSTIKDSFGIKENLFENVKDIVNKVYGEMEEMKVITNTQDISIPKTFSQLQTSLNNLVLYNISSLYVSTQNHDKKHNVSYQIEANKVQQVINELQEFQLAVSNEIMLKYLQCHDKNFTYIAQAFAEELHSSTELNTVTAIDMELNCLERFTSSDEMQGLKFLKTSLNKDIYCNIFSNVELGLSKQLTIIDEQISSLKESLVIHKEQFMPIKKDIFIFERSAWQTFNTFIANCSKFFIGNAIHCNIYGYGDGVEEIRREIDNMSSDEVELMLATIFDEANEMF